jgi:hypothetical protein
MRVCMRARVRVCVFTVSNIIDNWQELIVTLSEKCTQILRIVECVECSRLDRTFCHITYRVLGFIFSFQLYWRSKCYLSKSENVINRITNRETEIISYQKTRLIRILHKSSYTINEFVSLSPTLVVA